MSYSVTRALKRPRLRAPALAAVITLALLMGLAHSGVEADHMGKAAAICMAIAASAAIAVTARPRLGRLLPSAPRPTDWGGPQEGALCPALPYGRARGDPAVLQVFRR